MVASKGGLDVGDWDPLGEIVVVDEVAGLEVCDRLQNRPVSGENVEFQSGVCVHAQGHSTIGEYRQLIMNSYEMEADPAIANQDYLVYEDNSGNLGDVQFVRSTNGGTAWSTAITVNSNTAGIQSFPAMSVVSGRIDIIWYDSFNFRLTNNDHFDVFYSQSLDGGQTFAPDVQINSAPITNGGLPLGDYLGIASSTNYVYTAWIGPLLPTSTDIRDPIFTLLSSPGIGSGGAGGGGSIASGTLVTMADGTREPVQDLAVGDKLLMYDVYSHTSVTAIIDSIPTKRCRMERVKDGKQRHWMTEDCEGLSTITRLRHRYLLSRRLPASGRKLDPGHVYVSVRSPQCHVIPQDLRASYSVSTTNHRW